MSVWRIHTVRDYGLGNKVELDNRVTGRAYREFQRAMFRIAQERRGDYCRMDIRAANGCGLTLISEGMGLSCDGIQAIDDAMCQALEESAREGVV